MRRSVGHGPFARRAGLAALLSLAITSCSGGSGKQRPEVTGKRVTVFFTTELKGTIEPCGCTSDPLGDLARTARLISSARANGGAVLYVDGGSTLYADPALAASLVPQETLKSRLLRDQLASTLKANAIGVGPFDLALGTDIHPPRHAVNLPTSAAIPVAPPAIVEVGGVKVGIFGAVGPQALSSFGITATDPVPAAKTAVQSLRADGAQIVIGLLHMVRADAARVARAVPGIDFVLVGQNAPEPDRVSDEPIGAGSSWLIEPANRGQVVSRLDITVRPGGTGFSDALGEARARLELAELPETIAALEADLARWKTDTSADPAFVAAKGKELAALRARQKKLQTAPLEVPKTGSYFVFEQVRIKKSLACDASVVAAKQRYDAAAGEANLAAAKDVKPTPPAAGEAGYVGLEECALCHKKAVTHWRTTKHAKAWATLETAGKHRNVDCVSCHVTGWDKPGGSNLAFNESLRDVQCEVCHGPGSLHVDADGKGHIVRAPESALCEGCHSPEHSDTFAFDPYLRDITGPGHGEDVRKTLGDGPTGGELRAAALTKAGATIGEGCPK